MEAGTVRCQFPRNWYRWMTVNMQQNVTISHFKNTLIWEEEKLEQIYVDYFLIQKIRHNNFFQFLSWFICKSSDFDVHLTVYFFLESNKWNKIWTVSKSIALATEFTFWWEETGLIQKTQHRNKLVNMIESDKMFWRK